jgi:hypothetical protein
LQVVRFQLHDACEKIVKKNNRFNEKSVGYRKQLFILICTLTSFDVLAVYYDVLPKGVRNITYRRIQTGTIDGSFNSGGGFAAFDIAADINADVLEGVDSSIDAVLGTFSAAEREQFSLGKFETDIEAEVQAHALGVGVGVTRRLTVYAFTPFYEAEVRLNLNRTQVGQNQIDGKTISIDGIPSVDTKIIQSLFVNYYGYNPLGTWRGSDFGDTEVGFMYLLTKKRNHGTKITFGGVIPTGRVDDPDTLQDIGFGDGQYDIFVEYGGGVKPRRWLGADFWTRFTYQLPFHTDIRLPESADFPISTNKVNTKIQYGHEVKAMGQLNVNMDAAWSFSSGLMLTYKMPDDYNSGNEDADKILENDTEEFLQTGIMNLTFSTLPFFRKKQWPIPMNLGIYYQKDISGKNTPKIERVDLEMRVFF